MTPKEEVVVFEFNKFIKDDIVSNREFYYIMKNNPPYDFKTQKECDLCLASLIKRGKINPIHLVEDEYYPFTKELKETIESL